MVEMAINDQGMIDTQEGGRDLVQVTGILQGDTQVMITEYLVEMMIAIRMIVTRMIDTPDGLEIGIEIGILMIGIL